MNHDEARELIPSYADGELDAPRAAALEQHLAACHECRLAESRLRDLRDALRADAPAFAAPARLRHNIRAAIKREERTSRESISWLFPWAAAAACALLVTGALLFQSGSLGQNTVADEVIASHVRSLLATHLVDVASSDQHTVKPWFNGKVDFAPDVRDFAAEGFPLIGGRLDYLNSHTTVALVYQRHQHPINVLIAPAPGRRDAGPSSSTRRGYNLVHWTRGEMDYWAVSDLNGTELRQLTDLLTHG